MQVWDNFKSLSALILTLSTLSIRHSSNFYKTISMSVRSEGSRHSSVVSLISAYCADDDPNTRKFASFAGNNKYKLDSVCTTFIVVLFYNVFNFDALICVTSCVCIYSGKCCISFE